MSFANSFDPSEHLRGVLLYMDFFALKWRQFFAVQSDKSITPDLDFYRSFILFHPGGGEIAFALA